MSWFNVEKVWTLAVWKVYTEIMTTTTTTTASMYVKLRHPLGGYFTCRPYSITKDGDEFRLHFASGEVVRVEASDLLETEVAR
jgi:hypothetical protein